MKKVVIVAPTFKEQESLENFLVAVLAQSDRLSDWDLHVLISDSHSPDKTGQIAKTFAAKNPRVHFLDTKIDGPGRLGSGLFKGLDYAVDKLQADVLLTMEADLSNDPNQIGDFLTKIGPADLVIGSRYGQGGKIVNWSWWRKALSLGANYLLRILAWAPKTHEFTNLYRAFKKDVWQKLRAKMADQTGWLFVPAFVFEALGTDFKIVEQPIVYFDRFGGRSKMSTLSYTKNLLLYAVKFRLEKSASVFKFAAVGGLGFIVNTIVLVLGVHFGMRPSIAGPVGAEFAIMQGFALNNFWTFSQDRLKSWKEFPFKFIQYNLIAAGSVVIQFLFLRAGEIILGIEGIKSPILNLPIIRLYSWYMFFYMWGVGVGMVWNYVMYRTVVWKKNGQPNQKT